MEAANRVQSVGTTAQAATQVMATVRSATNWAVLVNAASLVGARVVTSGLGFIYWWLAARQFSTEGIGLAAAVISAMSLLGTIGMLGLNALLIMELPRHRGQEGRLVATALLMSAGAGLALGVVFALGAGSLFPGFESLAADPLVAALFAIGVGLTALTLVLDQALIGQLRGGVQLTRNGLFAVAKLAALVCVPLLLLDPTGTAIWATWVLGMVVSLAGIVVVAVRGGASVRRWRPDLRLMGRLRRGTGMHYLLDLSLEVPGLAMPLVVAAILSVSANAYFYTASMISALLAMAPISLAMATYAVGAQAPEHLPHRLRFSLVLSLALVAGANLVLFVAAEPMLRIFGDAYAQEAAWTLRILSLTVFARIVQVNYDVVSRLRGRLRSATVMVGLFGVVELGLAAVGGILYGLEGLALGWLAGACIQAAVMLPRVLGEARPRRTAQDTIPAAGP